MSAIGAVIAPLVKIRQYFSAIGFSSVDQTSPFFSFIASNLLGISSSGYPPLDDEYCFYNQFHFHFAP